MNIEQKIRNNKEAFDNMKMPEGSRERFMQRMEAAQTQRVSLQVDRHDRKIRFMTWTTVAAAAVTILMVISGMILDGKKPVTSTQTADNKLVEMRQFYDEKVEEAIINLEDVMVNVDDSTKMQINTVIHDLMNMGDVFAEMAPLPEDRQMAIAEQIYDNKLRTIELITEKINK